METNNQIGSECQMLIRKPVGEVFDAFINPEITKNFWFSKGSDTLAKGKSVTWEWEMYNASSNVFVTEIIENKQISIEWGEPPTIVDFLFESINNGFTYVVIKHYGFNKSGEELIAAIKDSTGGFTTVLDGLKAYLEYNIQLNLVGDKFLK